MAAFGAPATGALGAIGLAGAVGAVVGAGAGAWAKAGAASSPESKAKARRVDDVLEEAMGLLLAVTARPAEPLLRLSAFRFEPSLNRFFDFTPQPALTLQNDDDGHCFGL